MSRQKGRRSAPKPVKQAYVQSLRQSRQRRPLVPKAEPGQPITRARRWAAVGISTFLMLFSFVGYVAAVSENDKGNTADARSAVVMAAILALLAISALGSISRTPNPFRKSLLATPLAISGFVVVTYLLDDPATAVVLAFGIAGGFVLRRDRGHSVSRRVTVVVFLSLVTFLGYRYSPDAVLLVAPLLPFVACAVADLAAERMVPAE